MANDDSVDERAPLISAESAGSGGNIIPNGSGKDCKKVTYR